MQLLTHDTRRCIDPASGVGLGADPHERAVRQVVVPFLLTETSAGQPAGCGDPRRVEIPGEDGPVGAAEDQPFVVLGEGWRSVVVNGDRAEVGACSAVPMAELVLVHARLAAPSAPSRCRSRTMQPWTTFGHVRGREEEGQRHVSTHRSTPHNRRRWRHSTHRTFARWTRRSPTWPRNGRPGVAVTSRRSHRHVAHPA